MSPSHQHKCRKMYNEATVQELEGYVNLKAADKARVDSLFCIVRLSTNEESERPSDAPHAKMNPSASHSTSCMSQPSYQKECGPNRFSAAEATAQGPRGQDPSPPTAQEPELKPQSSPSPTPRTSAFAADKTEQQGPWSRSRTMATGGMSPEELKDLGNLNYRSGAYETAISYYTQAIDLKSDPIFFTNRAAAYIALKRFKPASDDCHVATLLTHHAPYYKTFARLAKCHLALGEPKAAIAAAQASLDCDSSASNDNPSLATKASAELMKQHLDQCADAWEKKAWAEAKRKLLEAIALCDGGGPAEWCVWEVEIAMAQCDWDEALVAAKRALVLHPESASIQTAAAQVHLFTNRAPASVIFLRAALRIEPRNAHAGTLLPRVEAIVRAKQAADRFYAVGQVDEASKEYGNVLDHIGCNDGEGQGGHLRAALLGNRAAVYTKMKRFDLARDDGLTALSIPNHPWRLEVLDKLARCLIALGDPDAALELVNTGLEIDPLDKDMLAIEFSAKNMQSDLRQSRASWAKRDWLDAKQALARAIVECPGECPIQWRIWTVEMEMAMRNWDGAVSIAEAVVGLHSTSAHAHAVLGLAMMFSNKLTLCLEPLKIALALNSEHPFAVRALRRAQDIEIFKEEGNQAFRLCKYPEAVQKYTEALDVIGEDDEEGGGGHLRAVLLSNRATALLKMERHARALTDILASLELQPTSFKALRTHGRVRMAQGYYEEAISIYTKAQQVWMSGDRIPADGEAVAQELRVAMAALETSQSKDYYGILRIPWNATEVEGESIRRPKIFSRLYLTRNGLLGKGGNPEHFKLLSEAYGVLSEAWLGSLTED
ncbi:hypothetical protein FRB97_005623 [Tulasnella sp. 331]|nr:hypothetical protein FRB97_005623 [Tulasnella sp. 331]